MGQSKTSGRMIRSRELEAKAIALRLEGLSYDEIGARLGCTRQGAHSAVGRVLKRYSSILDEDAPALLTLQMQRYEALLKAIWGDATGGDLQATGAAVRVLSRIDVINALDHSPELLTALQTRAFLRTFFGILEKHVTDSDTRLNLYNEMLALLDRYGQEKPNQPA